MLRHGTHTPLFTRAAMTAVSLALLASMALHGAGVSHHHTDASFDEGPVAMLHGGDRKLHLVALPVSLPFAFALTAAFGAVALVVTVSQGVRAPLSAAFRRGILHPKLGG